MGNGQEEEEEDVPDVGMAEPRSAFEVLVHDTYAKFVLEQVAYHC